MKIIITEKQNLFLRRRLEQIDEFVKLALKRVPTTDYSYHEYVDEIVWYVIDELGIYTMDEMELIGDYIRETYWKLIEEVYLRFERED
jgi:hypothetical protein